MKLHSLRLKPKFEKLIEQIEKDRENGGVSEPFDNAADFLKALES